MCAGLLLKLLPFHPHKSSNGSSFLQTWEWRWCLQFRLNSTPLVMEAFLEATYCGLAAIKAQSQIFVMLLRQLCLSMFTGLHSAQPYLLHWSKLPFVRGVGFLTSLWIIGHLWYPATSFVWTSPKAMDVQKTSLPEGGFIHERKSKSSMFPWSKFCGLIRLHMMIWHGFLIILLM